MDIYIRHDIKFIFVIYSNSCGFFYFFYGSRPAVETEVLALFQAIKTGFLIWVFSKLIFFYGLQIRCRWC